MPDHRVEPANAPALASRSGGRYQIDFKPTLADGLAVAEVGQLCFDIAREVVDQILLVDEARIPRACCCSNWKRWSSKRRGSAALGNDEPGGRSGGQEGRLILSAGTST